MTYFIFEMANNHNGSVEHAKRIISEFAGLARTYNLSAGIKLQFRQLGTFIHRDFIDSDLPYVKRFRSTELSYSEFEEIIGAIRVEGLDVIATPFDNESLAWITSLNVDIIKVASCSIDDWPLLRQIATFDRRIIISTAGASIETLEKVANIFWHQNRNFAFMHCVGEYPTDYDRSNLKRIDLLKERFPGIEIGISTHEPPTDFSIVPLAIAKGCSIVEKHVGVRTDQISLNAYSLSPRDMAKVIESVRMAEAAINGEPQNERQALESLKRGIYAKKPICAGSVVSESDLYFAMPCQDGQVNVSRLDEIVGQPLLFDVLPNDPLMVSMCQSPERAAKLAEIREWLIYAAKDYEVPVVDGDQVEISCHHGLERFDEMGALIVNKINREYCKKLIFMRAGQGHPTHHHIQKEEAFELLGGDCELVLNGRAIPMERGRPYVIARGVDHSFSSRTGCVIEEVSTTHIPGDSIYEDSEILKKRLEDRKICIKI